MHCIVFVRYQEEMLVMVMWAVPQSHLIIATEVAADQVVD